MTSPAPTAPPEAAGTRNAGEPVPGGDVRPHQVDLVAEVPEERPDRDVLRERHRVLLDVALGAALAGLGRAARRWRCARRPLEHGADDERRADGRGASSITTAGVGVAQRVDVGGVLGPDHEVGPARRRRRPGGRGPGHGDVVVEDGAALGVEVEPRLGTLPWTAMNRAGVPSVGTGTSSGANSRAPARARTGTARPTPVTGRPPWRRLRPRPVGPTPAG